MTPASTCTGVHQTWDLPLPWFEPPSGNAVIRRNPARSTENLDYVLGKRPGESPLRAGSLPSMVFGSAPCMDDQRNSYYQREPLDQKRT